MSSYCDSSPNEWFESVISMAVTPPHLLVTTDERLVGWCAGLPRRPCRHGVLKTALVTSVQHKQEFRKITQMSLTATENSRLHEQTQEIVFLSNSSRARWLLLINVLVTDVHVSLPCLLSYKYILQLVLRFWFLQFCWTKHLELQEVVHEYISLFQFFWNLQSLEEITWGAKGGLLPIIRVKKFDAFICCCNRFNGPTWLMS